MNFLISTIIPVFNCEKYIESSINSVINQSINFNNLQLIIIDDGSLDNSKKIIQTYIKKYNNIEYYYQENSGVGIASNHGLSKVKGEYVTFLGADDLLHVDAYKILYKNAKLNDCEISIGKIELFNENKKWMFSSHKKIFKNTRITNLANEIQLVFNASPANKLFNSQFVLEQKIKYPKERSHADAPFVISLMFKAKQCYISDKTVYYWRKQESGSGIKTISQNYAKTNSLIELNHLMLKMNKFFDNNLSIRCKVGMQLKNYHLFQQIIKQTFPNIFSLFTKKTEILGNKYFIFLNLIDDQLLAELPRLKILEMKLICSQNYKLGFFVNQFYKVFYGSVNCYLLCEKINNKS